MLAVRFRITVELENGDIWETVRHTKEGLDNYLSDVMKFPYKKFSVTEERYG